MLSGRNQEDREIIAEIPKMKYLAELAQSEFELASRFVAAPESNQRVGWLGRADLGV